MQRTCKFIWVPLFFVALALFAPQPAHAYTFYQPVTIDPLTGDVCPGPGLIRRIVPCIGDTILYTANQLLSSGSALAATAVAVACTLVMALWGAMMVTGKADASARGAVVPAVKLGAVTMFTANFGASYFDPSGTQGGFFGMLLDSMNWILGGVSGYVLNTNLFADNAACVVQNGETPILLLWDTLDCMLQILIGGIFDPSTLLMGLAGFFAACLFSGAAGFFLALLGFYIVIQLVLAIARSTYILVSSYTAFGMLIFFSPFFVPLILFRASRAYFMKYIRVTASFMVQPMIIAAYIGMLATAFDTVVYSGPGSLYRAIAGNAVGPAAPPSINPNFQIGQWLLGGSTSILPCGIQQPGVYCMGMLGGAGMQIDPKRAMEVLKAPTSNNAGHLGTIGQLENLPPGAWNDIFRTLGLGQDIDAATGLPDARFFMVGTPKTMVDFNALTDAAGASDDPEGYIINLFLSAIMAAVMAYIFMHMLDALPFFSNVIAEGYMKFGADTNVPESHTMTSKGERLAWNPQPAPAGYGQ